MSSNMGRTKALLGRYGLFQPGMLGNYNVNAAGAQVPWFPVTAQGADNNVIPANLSSSANGTPGSTVTNGSYPGQGITGVFDSGPLFFEQCSGWTKWGITARSDIPANSGQVQGFSAAIYTTFDWDTASGALTTYSTTTGLRTAGTEFWTPLPTVSDQSGNTWNNPMTAVGQSYWSNTHILALRISVTAITGGSVLFSIWAVP